MNPSTDNLLIMFGEKKWQNALALNLNNKR
jgi:hypothetical protein